MAESEEKTDILSLLVGWIAIIILLWIVYNFGIKPYPSLKLIFTVVATILSITVLILTYFSVKKPEVREKCLKFLNVLSLGIGKFGVKVIREYFTESKSKYKEARKPIPNQLKNKIYNRAGDKCQVCGKTGNLKIHHIDGNREHNTMSNLILLCGNHHDEADKGVLPKWRLKKLMKQQGTKTHVVHTG